jgi:glycosyltransferase involved in cell wall biosynthesis
MTTRIRPLRVCYFGTYRQEYSRNQIMIEGLRQAGASVTECHEPLWHGIEDRVEAASGGWSRPVFIWRIMRTYWHLLRRYKEVGDYDIMIVGYPGQLDVFMARLLTWLHHKPLVLDIFMSIYLIALERGLAKRSRFTIRILQWLEWVACRLPDLLILDTSEYVAWFGKIHGVPANRFRLVPTGADDRLFHPVEVVTLKDGLFRVLYYGSFIPNHGVPYIVEAACLLSGEPSIRFELIGDGPECLKAKDLAREYQLENIVFVEWMEKDELVRRVAQANACLGAFGTTPQSLMTIQNKIYEGLAMGKAVITGDSPAVRKALIHGEQVYLCERENPISLAKAIRTLKDNPGLCRRLGQNGHQIFLDMYNVNHIGHIFTTYLNEILIK